MPRTRAARVRREIEAHLAALIADGVARGLSPEEARRQARLAFGSVDGIIDACRDARRLAWLDDLWRDVRHALRLMRRAPGFTLFAIATLAGGVGANTAVFSVVHALLLASLPVARPEQLVVLSHGLVDRGGGAGFPAGFVRVLADGGLVQGAAARGGVERVTIGLDGGGEPAIGELVSGGFFELLGVTPAVGRLLTSTDDRTGAEPVVVLGYDYWQRRFAGDQRIVGRPLMISGRPMTVVGVSPRGFDGLDPGQRVDVRATLALQAAVRGLPTTATPPRREPWDLQVVARLADGVPIDAARPAIAAAFQRYIHDTGVTAAGAIDLASAASGAGRTRARVGATLRVLLAMTFAVLGVACANLAMLFAARSASRRPEWAVRTALGAGTARLARQLAVESLLLAGAGALVGALVAHAGAAWLATLVAGGGPLEPAIRPHPVVLAFHALAALAAGLGLAAGAVLRLRRDGCAPAGPASSRTTTGSRHRGLIAGQVALSMLVLVAAALFLRTMRALQATDLGSEPEHVLLAALDPKTAGRGDSEIAPFFREVRARLLAAPGVTAVSFSTVRALSNGRWSEAVTIEGLALDASARALRNAIGPDYFRALGIDVVAGREFALSDDAAAPKVAVVNEAFVRTFLAGTPPIGRTIGRAPTAYRIVGVVRDARQVHVRETAAPTWFIPYEQRPGLKHLDVIVRSRHDPEPLVAEMRRAVAAVDPRAALFEVRTQRAQIDELLAGERTLARLASIFAAVAATIAALGLYALLALVVAQRHREIALRLALGASAWRLTWTLASDVARAVLLGVAGGLAAAALLGHQARTMLFGVEAFDPTSLAAAATAMVLAAAAGAAGPLLRAARIAPATALRG
jgi:putative ABC transport system permease protein